MGAGGNVDRPEASLSPGVGQRIEDALSALNRVGRREGREEISKLRLSRAAGISRQTLYRALRSDEISRRVAIRLAEVLQVDPNWLYLGIGDGPDERGQWEPAPDEGLVVREESTSGYELDAFVGNLDRIVRLLSSGAGSLDVKSKLAILNGIEEAARLAGAQLPSEFWDLRRRVNEGVL